LNTVNIRVLPETREKLTAAKRGGESYDDLIRRLLAEAEG